VRASRFASRVGFIGSAWCVAMRVRRGMPAIVHCMIRVAGIFGTNRRDARECERRRKQRATGNRTSTRNDDHATVTSRNIPASM
jgi:hypothetical protein